MKKEIGKLVFLLFAFNLINYSLTEGDHDHDTHGTTREKLLTEIAESLMVTKKNKENKTVYTTNDVDGMFQRLGFLNCTRISVSSSCQLCLTSRDLYVLHNISTSSLITDKEFKEMLPSVIHFLLPVSNTGPCNVTDVQIKKKIPLGSPKTYNLLVKEYGSGKSSLHKESVEKILEKINSTIYRKLTNKTCFDIDDVIKGAGVTTSAIPDHDFEFVSAFIIWKLLGKHCISEHVSLLPTKEFFINQIFSEFGPGETVTFAKFEELLKKLSIGNEAKTGSSSAVDHDHRRKRSLDYSISQRPGNVDEANVILKRSRRNALTPQQVSAFAKTCYSPENLFKIHGFSEETKINKTQFKELGPAIIQQIESGACKASAATSKKPVENDWKAWVAALVAATVISLASLVGIVAAPFNKKSYFSKVLSAFVALGIGTLLGDAILHLFPHALGLHDHKADQHTDVTAADSFLWKGVCCVCAIYAFYLLEAIMHSCSKHGHSHGLEDTHQHLARIPSHRKQVKSHIELNARIEMEEKEKKHTHLVKGPSGVHQCESTSSLPQDTMADLERKDQLCEGKMDEGKSVIGNLRSVVYMVLIGDTLHNFIDGIAIGVAFTEAFPSGLYGGISTSIAILCHELPHEIGDFAILLTSGMSIKTALLLNFVSSMTAIVGTCVGVATGQKLDATPWIFAITAGLFVYIALVDMLPELLHSNELRKNPVPTILLQSAGLLLGFAIMLLLGAYEEEIKVKK